MPVSVKSVELGASASASPRPKNQLLPIEGAMVTTTKFGRNDAGLIRRNWNP